MKKLSMVIFTVVLALSAIYLLSSCASIIDGTDQEISIASSPDSAYIEIKTFGGIKVKDGTTPLKVILDKDEDYKVSVSLEGYEENEIIIKGEVNPVVFGNLLCGGIIGFIVDFSNGAAYTLEPEMIHIDLVQVVGANNKREHYLIIKMLDDKGEVQTMVSPFQERQTI